MFTKQRRGYQSTVLYEETRIHAAAIYCSDGRIGEQIDDFLHQGLKLPRYDRLACPGGPACMAGQAGAWWESVALERQLRFLLQVHHLENLVLISHSNCAFYLQHLSVGQHRCEAEQMQDLARAAERVKRLNSTLGVHCFFARQLGPHIIFELISTTE